jgi:hypothetical protein
MRTVILIGVLLTVAGALASAATLSVAGRDTAAIQAMIRHAKPGDTVLLPAGTYSLTETLALKSGTTLAGAGQGATTLRFAGDKPWPMIALNGVEGITVRDFTLDGAASDKASRGVSAYNSHHLTLQHLTIRDLGAPGALGVHFNGQAPTRKFGVMDSLIADCTFVNMAPHNDWGGGIRFSWGSCRNTVRGCRIENAGRGGIFADNGSTDLILSHNVVVGSTNLKLSIEVWGGCDRCVIEDNRLDHWLSIGGCDWVAVRRNLISDTGGSWCGYGLEAIGSTLIITDNVVDGGQMIGLSVSGSQPKRWVYYGGNIFRHCSTWAVQLQGEAGRCDCQYFYRCQFSDTTFGQGKVAYPGYEGHGFRINGDTGNLVLEECEMDGNARLGAQLGGRNVDNLDFIGCTIKGNGGAAVEGPANYTALAWTDCQVSGNRSDTLPAAKAFAAAPPTVSFTASPKARAGQPVRFRSEAQAAQGEIFKALWDFGEGLPETGRMVRHTFSAPGDYPVTLVAWDSQGRARRAQRVVTVGE